MRSVIILTAAVAAIVGGCAQRSDQIQAASVSPIIWKEKA